MVPRVLLRASRWKLGFWLCRRPKQSRSKSRSVQGHKKGLFGSYMTSSRQCAYKSVNVLRCFQTYKMSGFGRKEYSTSKQYSCPQCIAELSIARLSNNKAAVSHEPEHTKWRLKHIWVESDHLNCKGFVRTEIIITKNANSNIHSTVKYILPPNHNVGFFFHNKSLILLFSRTEIVLI